MIALDLVRLKGRIQKPSVQIFLVSFLILFFELALIRLTSAYILNLAYFSNLILISSFFGSGIGLMISRKPSIFKFFPYALLFIVVLLSYRFNLAVRSSGALYFQNPTSASLDTSFGLAIPLIFFIVSLPFIILGQKLGTLFGTEKPLSAYLYNLLGSLTGILVFTLFSFLQTDPVVWLLLALIVYLLLNVTGKILDLTPSLFVYLIALLLLALLNKGSYWSPYYKIASYLLEDRQPPQGYVLTANQTGHQTLEIPERKDWIYSGPYQFFNQPQYDRVLIIGAGGGNDVALALKNGAKSVDAVEIDPVIAELGRRLHPSQPYADPRVNLIINDGRNYLEKTDKKYDLIIFALTDSLALTSSYSNTRLESYLFTQESFRLAQKALSPNGLLAFYNFYRQPWLVDKIVSMAESAFKQSPFILIRPTENYLGTILIGPKLKDLKENSNYQPTLKNLTPATDDWPFLYLKSPSLPRIYVAAIATILLIGSLIIFLLLRKTPGKARLPFKSSAHFFFLGAAFLLVETKNVINFQLLFGSTWLVNTLVFLAIMVLVLLGTLLTRKGRVWPSNYLYLGLLIILLINLVLPLKILQPLPDLARYVVTALLTLSPVFFSNLIFSRSLSRSSAPELSLGANLLGAVIGGFCEYLAMIVGYHYILGLILFLYLASWLTQPADAVEII